MKETMREEKTMNVKPSKERILKAARNGLFLVLGSALLALANALFLVPFSIVKGGMTSVAMILSDLLLPLFQGRETTDLWLWALNVLLWFVAFFAVSKDFALKSLVGTLAYPAFLSLFLRLDLVGRTGLLAYAGGDVASVETAKLTLLGLAGGVLNGIGLSLCFIGEGSTGGSDVLSVLLTKYTDLKQDAASLLIDTLIILGGFAAYRDWGKLLVGILTAFSSSFALKALYGKFQSLYVFEVVSTKMAALQEMVQKEFHKSGTLDSVVGGYSKEKKEVLRIVLTYKESKRMYAILEQVDPQAFVSVYEASAAYGGSFRKPDVPKKEKERMRKELEETQKKDREKGRRS